MFSVVLHRRSGHYFERLSERLKHQLREKLELLSKDPLKMPGVKAMAGEWKGYYRLRHGDLRIIYMIDQTRKQIIVSHIGPRGDIYK